MYGKKYKKRRPYRKRKATTKRTTKSNKNITRVVKRVLHSQIENKQNYYLGNFEVVPKMEIANIFEVIPPVIQGVKQGQRIGNRIKVMSLKLGVSMTMVALPYAPADTGRSGIFFDFYVFKVIQKPSYDIPINNTDLDYFLNAGDAFNGYTGQVYNWHQYVNKDRFNILYKKRILMNNNYHKADANNYLPFEGYGQNTNSATSFDISLTKNILKNLKYQDTVGAAVNDAIYCTCVATRADTLSPVDPTYPVGQFSCYSQLVYEDA